MLDFLGAAGGARQLLQGIGRAPVGRLVNTNLDPFAATRGCSASQPHSPLLLPDSCQTLLCSCQTGLATRPPCRVKLSYVSQRHIQTVRFTCSFPCQACLVPCSDVLLCCWSPSSTIRAPGVAIELCSIKYRCRHLECRCSHLDGRGGQLCLWARRPAVLRCHMPLLIIFRLSGLHLRYGSTRRVRSICVDSSVDRHMSKRLYCSIYELTEGED